MAAELERKRETPAHVVQTLDEASGDLADEEVDGTEPGRGAVAPGPEELAIEDDGSRDLYLLIRCRLYGRRTTGAQLQSAMGRRQAATRRPCDPR
jgi:hypothetical protein